jgi:hypothetical protein
MLSRSRRPCRKRCGECWCRRDALAKRDEGAWAHALLEQARRKAPWYPPVHYNLAMMSAMNKEYGGAIAAMTAYLEIAPDAPDARRDRRVVLFQVVRIHDALFAPQVDGDFGERHGDSNRPHGERNTQAGQEARRPGIKVRLLTITRCPSFRNSFRCVRALKVRTDSP